MPHILYRMGWVRGKQKYLCLFICSSSISNACFPTPSSVCATCNLSSVFWSQLFILFLVNRNKTRKYFSVSPHYLHPWPCWRNSSCFSGFLVYWTDATEEEKWKPAKTIKALLLLLYYRQTQIQNTKTGLLIRLTFSVLPSDPTKISTRDALVWYLYQSLLWSWLHSAHYCIS